MVRAVTDGRRRRHALVIKAEGVPVASDRLKALVDERIADETRVTVLGHVVRGGRPSAFDRMLGVRFGVVAARLLMKGETRLMTAWTPPPELAGSVGRRAGGDPSCWAVDLGAALEETRGMLEGANATVRWRSEAFERFGHLFRL